MTQPELVTMYLGDCRALPKVRHVEVAGAAHPVALEALLASNRSFVAS